VSALIMTSLIELGAFWLSFTALTDLAIRAGVHPSQAWVWPLIVDGVIVVATVSVIALVGHGRAVSAYPWALLLAGATVSVLANVAHAVVISDGAVPAALAGAVAAVPPITLVASTHLSAVLLNRAERKPRARAQSTVVSVEHSPAVSAQNGAGERRRERVAKRPVSELQSWYDEQVAAGKAVTGKDVAEEFGFSPATGRRRLAELRSGDLVAH
jgi:hypothetical protein